MKTVLRDLAHALVWLLDVPAKFADPYSRTRPPQHKKVAP